MKKTHSPAATAAASDDAGDVTQVRLLITSHLGIANDVIYLPAADVADAEANGYVDSDPAAVAYAAALPQNQAAA